MNILPRLTKLRRELRRAGADKTTAQQLALLSDELNKTTNLPVLSETAKKRIAENIGIHSLQHHPRLRLASAMAMSGFIALVIVAQSARPGRALYGLKRESEEVRVLVQPSFKQEIEKRRQQEQTQQQSEQETIPGRTLNHETEPTNPVGDHGGPGSSEKASAKPLVRPDESPTSGSTPSPSGLDDSHSASQTDSSSKDSNSSSRGR